MLNIFYKNGLSSASGKNNVRHFYRWLTIVFNRVDASRVKEVGPDRACAEWLMRNGASIRWKGASEFLDDYNCLPNEAEKFFIQGIDATDSAIHHIGFPHFDGCKHIKEIRLVRCGYIENQALPLLSFVKDSLMDLEVSECKNITDEALLELKILTKLKSLKLGGLPYVRDHSKVTEELKKALPNCKIDYSEFT